MLEIATVALIMNFIEVLKADIAIALPSGLLLMDREHEIDTMTTAYTLLSATKSNTISDALLITTQNTLSSHENDDKENEHWFVKASEILRKAGWLITRGPLPITLPLLVKL
ncbi:hypothetical protein OO184_18935 [Photorhabdus sp. APURE]|uniref:hypothetical protein n=1 Tax=Photorhabdus aballayi TaxID=2991723 RepID=UPI00223CEA7B|nr:hypothetical protein [Photorhabdus aballayi]MCW7549955.1 hypothetical protein [Photorhabdus aballayi]